MACRDRFARRDRVYALRPYSPFARMAMAMSNLLSACLVSAYGNSRLDLSRF